MSHYYACAFFVLALFGGAGRALAQDETPPRSHDTGLTGAVDEETFKAMHELREGDVPKPQGETIALGGGKAYLSLPKDAKGPLPAVIVIHEWWGLNDNIRHWSDRLAALGFAAVAVDLYEGTVATTREEAMKAYGSVDSAKAHAMLQAAMSFVRKDARIRAPKVASIGWCFGGGWSLNCALVHPDLDAAVIYYGRLTTDPDALKSIKARVCGVFGKQDSGIPAATVDAFEDALGAADVRHEIHRYDANHAFANPSSARYDQVSAARAWRQVSAFLQESLQPK
ncbi:MAG: dienelactone hydrolase family protein [Planctomycetes bacterium]|nr:dienelactone hydrolase family protein [Planctomycetota bacterium]